MEWRNARENAAIGGGVGVSAIVTVVTPDDR